MALTPKPLEPWWRTPGIYPTVTTEIIGKTDNKMTKARRNKLIARAICGFCATIAIAMALLCGASINFALFAPVELRFFGVVGALIYGALTVLAGLATIICWPRRR